MPEARPAGDMGQRLALESARDGVLEAGGLLGVYRHLAPNCRATSAEIGPEAEGLPAGLFKARPAESLAANLDETPQRKGDLRHQ
jgi:hypothetical protein